MRTTIDIDDDVLAVAKELARSQKTTAGKILSELARRGLRGNTASSVKSRNGFEVLSPGGKPVTVKIVDQLLEDDV